MTNREHFSIDVENLVASQRRRFCFGQDFRLDHSAILSEFGLRPTDRVVDLLRIGASVYFVDRIVKRSIRSVGQPVWRRRIAVTVPVRDLEFWRQEDVQERLMDTLGFVSDDDWFLRFVKEESTSRESQQLLFDRSGLFNSKLVCLYSGGLDSAAGMVRQLAGAPSAPIAITVRHRTELAKNVKGQLSGFNTHFNTDIKPFVFPMSMNSPKKLVGIEETTQRARSFLFLCCGAAVLSMTQADTLQVFESGIGAINVPLLASMRGSQATRGAHPTFLSKASGFLQLVLTRSITIDLPFKHMTKGEVVSSMRIPALREIANLTTSCVKYPLRNRTAKSCGVCPACLFRRVALLAAGIDEDKARYAIDVFDSAAQLNGKNRRALCAYLNQYDSLQSVATPQLPISVAKHLRQTGLIDDQNGLTPFLELFSKHQTEWAQFVVHGREQGCSWANLVTTPQAA